MVGMSLRSFDHSTYSSRSFMLIDSHCHLDLLDLTPYNGDLSLVLKAANANDVQRFLCVCVDLTRFPNIIAITEQYPHIWATLGLHPNEEISPEPTVEELLQLAQH